MRAVLQYECDQSTSFKSNEVRKTYLVVAIIPRIIIQRPVSVCAERDQNLALRQILRDPRTRKESLDPRLHSIRGHQYLPQRERGTRYRICLVKRSHSSDHLRLPSLRKVVMRESRTSSGNHMTKDLTTVSTVSPMCPSSRLQNPIVSTQPKDLEKKLRRRTASARSTDAAIPGSSWSSSR